MSNRFYSVIWVPHSEGRFRKYQISQKGLTALGSVAAVFLLAALVLGIHYAKFHGQLSEVRLLREMNAELRRQNLAYEVSTEQLNKRVGSLQDFVMKLSVMAGLPTEPSSDSAGGVGGSANADIDASDSAFELVRESLEQMSSELTTLEAKSRVIERFYEDHTLMLASTPSIWPVRGYFSSTFGYRKDPFTGQREMHYGIDISTPIGRSIVAPADGTVLVAARRGGFGNIVVIDHKFGYLTKYGHLRNFKVRAGQRIGRGEVIGYVGNTGKSAGPHLHYEVWVGDRPTHPLNYILEYSKTFSAPNLPPPPEPPLASP